MSQSLSPWCDCRRLGSTLGSWRWQDINIGNPLWRWALLKVDQHLETHTNNLGHALILPSACSSRNKELNHTDQCLLDCIVKYKTCLTKDADKHNVQECVQKGILQTEGTRAWLLSLLSASFKPVEEQYEALYRSLTELDEYQVVDLGECAPADRYHIETTGTCGRGRLGLGPRPKWPRPQVPVLKLYQGPEAPYAAW